MPEYSDDYEEEYTRKSRSQKKRESTALQVIGEELTYLSEGALKDIGLPEALLEAVLSWKSFSGHEAKRRQMQYIGKVMREVDDIDELQRQIDIRKQGHEANNQILHKSEDLRKALLGENEAQRDVVIKRILADYPETDKAKLLHLVQGCFSANKKNSTRMAKELFRYLRDIVSNH